MDGTITRVEILQGGARLGESTDDSHSLTWTNVPAGKYSLTAKATDDSGATVTSAPVENFCQWHGRVAQRRHRAFRPAASISPRKGHRNWAHWD